MSVILKFIPNVMEEAGRSSYELPYFLDKSIKDYINESLALLTEDPFLEYKIIVSGKIVDDLNAGVNDDDEIIITPKIKEPISTFLVWLGGGSLLWGVAQAAMFAYTVYSAFQVPRAASYDTLGIGIDDGSPTYSWNGIQTTQDVGGTVPVIYGEHKVGGNIINAFIRNDGDKNYLNVLLALAEGEIEEIASVKIKDNPIANFDNVTTYERMGTNDQTVISNFEDAHNLYDVTVSLTKDNPHVYTTIDSDVESFGIHLALSSGLFQQDATGNILDWAVTYKVEYKLHADPSYTNLGETTITAKSRAVVKRVYRKTGLTAGQYDIKVTRISDDSQLSPIKQGDLTWNQLDEIKTDDFRYPNTALLGVEALADDQLSGGMPNFTCVVKGKKISCPKVMNGATHVDWADYYYDSSTAEYKLLASGAALTWDGVTYEEQYCANPIWCLKDLMVNTRFGLGEFIDTNMINASLSVEMSKVCEEKIDDGAGGYEKRYRLDVVLDSVTRALDLISQLCVTFRGLPFYSNGTINVRIDKPDTAVQLFTMGNVQKGSFSQSWKSIKDKPNVIDVQFLDKEKDYKQETISYIDEVALTAGDPLRKRTIKIFTTKSSYALREARYILKQSKYINKTISFGAGIDAVACQAGDLISFSHDVTQWGYSGRVKGSSTTTKVVLDRNVTLAAGTYHLLVQFADDTIEEKVVSTGVGTTSIIEVVGDAFSQAPQIYDTYAFGISTAPKKDFRIISMGRDRDFGVNVTGTEYESDIYDDTAVDIPDTKYSALDLTIPNVSDLALTERLATMPDGTIEEAIDVWWYKPAMTDAIRQFDHVKIYISEDNLNWALRGESNDIHFRIQGDLKSGNKYYVRVVTITVNGEENQLSASPYDDITLSGLPAIPSDVANFASNFDDDLELTWDKITNNDLAGYEIRSADNSWGVDSADLIYRGLVNSYTYQPASRTPGTIYIKSYNTSGSYSATAQNVTPTNSAPAAPTVTDTVWFGMATLDWGDSADVDLQYYEVYQSETGAWAGEEFLVKKVKGTQANIQGKTSVNAEADAVDATSITDAELIGSGTDEFKHDYVRQTSGTYKDQVAIATAYDDSTGKVTVASWPSGTPDVGDEFALTDRAFFKVRGVDTYGAGSFSSEKTISFDPLSEFLIEDGSITTDKLADLAVTEGKIAAEAVTAGKLYTGELITLSAQIKDAIITSAKILNLNADKINVGTLTGFTIRTSATNPRVEMSGDSLKIYDAGGNLVVVLGDVS